MVSKDNRKKIRNIDLYKNIYDSDDFTDNDDSWISKLEAELKDENDNIGEKLEYQYSSHFIKSVDSIKDILKNNSSIAKREQEFNELERKTLKIQNRLRHRNLYKISKSRNSLTKFVINYKLSSKSKLEEKKNNNLSDTSHTEKIFNKDILVKDDNFYTGLYKPNQLKKQSNLLKNIVQFTDSPSEENRSIKHKKLPLRKMLPIVASLILCLSVTGCDIVIVPIFKIVVSVYSDLLVNDIVVSKPDFNIDLSLCPDSIEKKYMITYIPDGFKEDSESSFNILYLKDWYNSNNFKLCFKQNVINTTFLVNYNTNVTKYIKIKVNDCDGYFYTNKKNNCIIWIENNYFFSISSQLSKKELLKIAESLKQIE